MIYQYKVNANKHVGIRLDKYISLNLSHLSRSKIKFLINEKKVLVNGLNKDPDYKIILNDKIKVIEEIKNERSIIGYAGSVQEYEGLNLLIEGVKNLVDCGLDVSLLIISNETDVAKLLEFCENLGVGDYVHITGPVSRSEIRSYLNMIDVFVVPRLDDSRMSRMVTPMKQMEPMALGIPLLISDIKAIRGITGEGLVTTFEPGSMEDLSEKIRFLISGDKRVQEKVKKGVEWVRKEGTWDISVEKAIHLYDQLIRNESS